MSELENFSSADDLRFWKGFGFDTIVDPESEALIGIVPEQVVALLASGTDQIDRQQKALRKIGIPPCVWTDVAPSQRLALYRNTESCSVTDLARHFNECGRVYGPGEPVQLPSGPFHCPEKYNAKSVNDLTSLDRLDEQRPDPDYPYDDDLPQQIGGGTLLDQFTLLGRGAELEQAAPKSLPLLGGVVLSGQSTVIYAQPNTGKTLLTMYLLGEAALTGQLVPCRTYYINADDSQQGLGEKTSILDEAGIHTLSPGSLDFTTSKLVHVMTEMIATDDCKDVVIVVDTLKKFVDLMEKKQSASFGDGVRQFVMKGGTFIALAHTRKNVGANGEPVYGGTSDIVEDFDAACLLVPLGQRSSKNEKLVQFQFKKRRGPNVDEYYAYDDEPECSYAERFASVRLVEDDEQDRFAAAHNQRTDLQLIDSIRDCIGSGVTQKMALVRAVAAKTGVSRRAAMTVLERYTGNDPETHHWFFAIRERGAKLYSVHPPGEPGS